MENIPNVQWIKDKCMEALDHVDWIDNVRYPEDVTVGVATRLARQGLDGGKTAVLQLRPKNDDFGGWMAYAGLCTVLYNRGRASKKYTILRNCYIRFIAKTFTPKRNRELALEIEQVTLLHSIYLIYLFISSGAIAEVENDASSPMVRRIDNEWQHCVHSSLTEIL